MWSTKSVLTALTLGIIAVTVGVGWVLSTQLPDVPAPELTGARDFILIDDNGSPITDIDQFDKDLFQRFNEVVLTDRLFQNGVTYCLVLFPTFDQPILMEARRNENRATLKVKTLSGRGGYELGNLSENIDRSLTNGEWMKLEDLVEASSFWSSPDLIDEAFVNDGATWILYGRDFRIYHRMTRTLPKQKQEQLFQYILTLAGRRDVYKGYLRIAD